MSLGFGLALDFLAPLSVIAIFEFRTRLIGLPYDRVKISLYVVACIALNVAERFHVISQWVANGAVIAMVLAILVSGGGGGGGRRRKRSALKRAKEWLATGIPAARPEAAKS